MGKRRRFLLQTAVFSLVVMISLSAWAARSAVAGKGGHQTSPDYGDLFVLLRDMRGVPVLDADSCQQPIASAAFAGCEQIVQREGVVLAEELIPEELIGQCLVPTDPATCAVLVDYANYTQEVEFGRTSVVRSPD